MQNFRLSTGKGRLAINLKAEEMGDGIIVRIYNRNAHIGAVAAGEYDPKTNRASTSVITRPGHKDDAIAQRAAYLISKNTGKPSCVIAGIHLDDITSEEIETILAGSEKLVQEFLQLAGDRNK